MGAFQKAFKPMPSTSSELLRTSLGFCLLFSTACTGDDADIPASQLDFLELLPTFQRVEVGESLRFGVERVNGATTENVSSKVTLRSDDEDVLQVEDGNVVRAVGPGTAHVTVEHDGARASAEVAVISAVSALELDQVDFWLARGTTKPFGAVLIAGDSKRAFDTGSWGSRDPEIASVDADGVVTGRGLGVTEITLSRSGLTTSREVRVEDFEPDAVQLVSASGNTLVAKGSSAVTVEGTRRALTQDLTALFELAVEGDSDTLKLAGSSISAGDVAGSAKVIARGRDGTIAAGQQAELEIEVIEASAIETVHINLPEELALGMEETAFEVLGDYGLDNELTTAPTTLTAEPADVVAIRSSRGTIVPLKVGEAKLALKVTVPMGEEETRDVEASHDIRVVDTPLSMLSVSLNAESAPTELAPGQTLQLEATAHYGTLAQTVTQPTLWTSSNPDVAIVSNVQAGLVTALKAGTTTVQARYQDQSAEYELVVE
jgi:uncharacterized protein YjdB